MSSLRAKFYRGERVKYISHLDLMLAFERALRRANIPIAYSQGFNPHPQMVFGLPLSVGVTSEAEYADFELSEYLNPEEFTGRLNKSLPEGFRIIEAKVKKTKANIMASIAMASYAVLIAAGAESGFEVLREQVERFMLRPVIMAKKEGKNGIREIDIRPMIHKLELKNAEGCSSLELQAADGLNGKNGIFCLSTLLSAGSVENLKPELLVSAFGEAAGIGVKPVKIHRTGLFIGKEGRISDPLDESALL